MPPLCISLVIDRLHMLSRIVQRMECKDPAPRANAKQCLHRFEKRIKLLIRVQIAANEAGVLASTAVFHDRYLFT